jgi:hypothetical protein
VQSQQQASHVIQVLAVAVVTETEEIETDHQVHQEMIEQIELALQKVEVHVRLEAKVVETLNKRGVNR